MAAPGAGARAPGPSQAREPASRRKWVPPLPLQRPLPPPPPPQSQARPPRTCAKRHQRVPGRGTDPGGGTGTRLPPPSVAGGRRGGTGRGRKGQGERRVKGRPGARRGRPGRSGHAGAAAATTGMRPGRGARPLAPHPQTAHAPACSRLPAPPLPSASPSPFVAGSYRSQNVSSAAWQSPCTPSTP